MAESGWGNGLGSVGGVEGTVGTAGGAVEEDVEDEDEDDEEGEREFGLEVELGVEDERELLLLLEEEVVGTTKGGAEMIVKGVSPDPCGSGRGCLLPKASCTPPLPPQLTTTLALSLHLSQSHPTSRPAAICASASNEGESRWDGGGEDGEDDGGWASQRVESVMKIRRAGTTKTAQRI